MPVLRNTTSSYVHVRCKMSPLTSPLISDKLIGFPSLNQLVMELHNCLSGRQQALTNTISMFFFQEN